jgi:hypothetical protein
MLINILPYQVPIYKDVIDEAINANFPNCEEQIRTGMYKELLIDTMQLWISYNNNESFEGVLITQIREEFAQGAKMFTLLCMHAPGGTNQQSFIDGWPTLQKFGLANNCKVFDFYIANEAAVKYAKYFSVIKEVTYMQIDITKEKGD